MWRSITRTLLAATLIVSAAPIADAQYTEQELPAPISGNATDQLGFSCDIDGDAMIVGAPYATVDGAANRGLAVVYRRDLQGDWVVEAELKPSDPDSALLYAGWSVGISEDTAVVGVPHLAPNNPPPPRTFGAPPSSSREPPESGARPPSLPPTRHSTRAIASPGMSPSMQTPSQWELPRSLGRETVHRYSYILEARRYGRSRPHSCDQRRSTVGRSRLRATHLSQE